MLGDFPIGVPYRGERYTLIVRDVSTAAFFFGFPENLPLTACWRALEPAAQWAQQHAFAAWMRGLVPRVAVDPELGPEDVGRLGASLDETAMAYLHAVDWITDADLDKSEKVEYVRDEFGVEIEKHVGPLVAIIRRYRQSLGALGEQRLPVPSPPADRSVARDHRPLIATITPHVRLAIMQVARRAHVRPSVLWLTPISEFMLDWRTCGAGVDDDELAELGLND
jgi:hypothetical protein